MNNLVCLCGSTKFLNAFNEANVELTKRGLSIVTISMCLPRNEQGNQEDEALKEYLDLIHLNKVLRADSVFVIGPGYFGKSTAREILWAEMQGKPVIVGAQCASWDEAANRVKHGVVDTYIYPKAKKILNGQ